MSRICNLLSATLFAALSLIAQLPRDAKGCADSEALPKLALCRIDNCESKDNDQRNVAVREKEKGEPVTAALDGDSRSIMYECAVGATPASIVQEGVAGLRAAGFSVLYQFQEVEGAITARKNDFWVLLDAADRFYTLVELKAAPPDFESITEAVGFADAIERYGHVPVYGIHFPAGRAELLPDSASALRELAAMLEAHPDWRLRIESHTDNFGGKMANMTLSARRAAAVASWLVGNGIKRIRLETAGLGETRPVANNSAEEGRAKNERIELVRISAQQ